MILAYLHVYLSIFVLLDSQNTKTFKKTKIFKKKKDDFYLRNFDFRQMIFSSILLT
jgi:hypothetical protein